MSRPEVLSLAMLMVCEMRWPNAFPPPARGEPSNIRAVHKGSLGLPSVPGWMGLGGVGLHWARMVVAATVPRPLLRLMEYQSAEKLKPSRKDGVSTTPPEIVRAISG